MTQAIYDGHPPSFTRGAYYGRRQLGELAQVVPPGGYFAAAIALPADNGKRVRAAVTRWPVAGTFVPAEDGSHTYAGGADYALWVLAIPDATRRQIREAIEAMWRVFGMLSGR